MIVDAGQQSYAEILKLVKETMGGNSVADVVRSTVETRNGHLKLNVDKRRGKADDIVEFFKIRVGGNEVRKVGPYSKKRAVHISGMDELTTAEDIKLEIRKYLVNPEQEVVVKNLRPQRFGGMQMATLVVDEQTAQKIADKREVRIGLSYCRTRLRVDLPTCYRC